MAQIGTNVGGWRRTEKVVRGGLAVPERGVDV